MSWLFSPKVAAIVAAFLFGRIDIAPELIKICQRESRCEPVGVHARDAWLSRTSWKGQVQLGHLDRSCQPYVHGRWATRGPWGLNASAHWEYVPRCYEPHWFDVPLFSALVAARKYLRRCDRKRTRLWCGRSAD